MLCILINFVRINSENTAREVSNLISVRRSSEMDHDKQNESKGARNVFSIFLMLMEPKGLQLPQFQVPSTTLIEESKANSNGNNTI